MKLLYFRMASGRLWIFKLYNEMFIHEYFAVIDNHLHFYTNMKIFGIYVFEWIGVAEIWKLLKSRQGTKHFLCLVPEAEKNHFAFVMKAKYKLVNLLWQILSCLFFTSWNSRKPQRGRTLFLLFDSMLPL
jgi:hypothetical protein